MKCILVIDDSRTSAFMAQSVFQRRGAQVLMAMDGHTGIQMARTHHPDIILLDYVLPDMKGDEVCRILKQDALTAPIPILVVTVYGKEEALQACRDAGAEDILLKPYSNEVLISRVSDLLRLPSRQFLRILVRMESRNEAKKGLIFATSENLSIGGIYLRTTHRMGEGEKIKMQFYLPRNTVPIIVEGEILRVEIRPDIRGYGFGIRFTKLSHQDKTRIENFIQERQNLTPMPSHPSPSLNKDKE